MGGAEFAQLYHTALSQVRSGSAAGHAQWVAALARLAERPANEPYYEQFLFLQALLRHAAGQELAARQTLAPLTTGTTPTAGYYQYVLGLWQLQQQQYATAASQLALAAAHGATDARLPRAWALALAGQADSAQAEYRRLAAGPALPALRQLGQALRTPAQVQASSAGTLAGSKELAEAQRAEAAGQLPEATRRYRALVQQVPFNERAVLAAGAFFTKQQAHSDAYDALNTGLTENPASLPLLRAYVLAAAEAGLAELGQSALAQLRPQVSPAEYANLLAQFAARRAAHAAAGAAFDQPPVPAR